MYIKLLRNTVADGQPVSKGQEVSVTDATGKTLVQMGKAVELPSPIGRGAGGEGREPVTMIAVVDEPTEPENEAQPIEPEIIDPAPIVEPARNAPPPPASRGNGGKGKGGK